MAQDVFVIGNCHSIEIVDFLSAGIADISFDYIAVQLGREHVLKKYDALLKLESEKGNILVISQPISDNTGPVSRPVVSSSMRAHFAERFKTYTNIWFDGLHPDTTYFGTMENRIPGIVGHYHSKLILYAYITHRNEDDCRSLFNHKTYDVLGYFDQFDLSAKNLLARDVTNDIQLASAFLDMVREVPSLYTFNHPTPHVFSELVPLLCVALNLNYRIGSGWIMTSNLAPAAVWPVMQEVADFHRLRYPTPQVWLLPKRLGVSRVVELPGLISLAYKIYGSVPDQAALRAACKRLPWWDLFVHRIS